jgi:ATP-dependent DNA helicase RecG
VVTLYRRIVRPEVMRLIAEADTRFQLKQRERIALGALALSEGLTARELAEQLETDAGELGAWLGRLLGWELVRTTGRTQGTRYFVEPTLLDGSGVKLPTSLKLIEPHRLAELVREDLRRHPGSKIGEIGTRIGPEINRSRLRRTLAALVRSGVVVMQGQRAGARYYLRSDP